MSERTERPLDAIAPDEMTEWYDAETVEEALREAERRDSTTPRERRKRCPDCGSVRIQIRPGYDMRHRDDARYRCDNCTETFDEPAPPRSEVEDQ